MNVSSKLTKEFNALFEEYRTIYAKNIETIKEANPEEIFVPLDLLREEKKVNFDVIRTSIEAWKYNHECRVRFQANFLDNKIFDLDLKLFSLTECKDDCFDCIKCKMQHEFYKKEDELSDLETSAFAESFLELSPKYFHQKLKKGNDQSLAIFIDLLRRSFSRIEPDDYTMPLKLAIHGGSKKFKLLKQNCINYEKEQNTEL